MEFQFVRKRPNFKLFVTYPFILIVTQGVDREETKKANFVKKIRKPVSKENLFKQQEQEMDNLKQLEEITLQINEQYMRAMFRRSSAEERIIKFNKNSNGMLGFRSSGGFSMVNRQSLTHQKQLSELPKIEQPPLDLGCYFNTPECTIYEPFIQYTERMKGSPNKQKSSQKIKFSMKGPGKIITAANLISPGLNRHKSQMITPTKNSIQPIKKQVSLDKKGFQVTDYSDDKKQDLELYPFQQKSIDKSPQTFRNKHSIEISSHNVSKQFDFLTPTLRTLHDKQRKQSRQVSIHEPTNTLGGQSIDGGASLTKGTTSEHNKESHLIQMSRQGFEQFKLFELGIDKQSSMAKNIQFISPSINQKLAKKWDVTAEIIKRKDNKDVMQNMIYSQKIRKGIQYKEDKMKEEMKIKSRYKVQKQELKLPNIKDVEIDGDSQTEDAEEDREEQQNNGKDLQDT